MIWTLVSPNSLFQSSTLCLFLIDPIFSSIFCLHSFTSFLRAHTQIVTFVHLILYISCLHLFEIVFLRPSSPFLPLTLYSFTPYTTFSFIPFYVVSIVPCFIIYLFLLVFWLFLSSLSYHVFFAFFPSFVLVLFSTFCLHSPIPLACPSTLDHQQTRQTTDIITDIPGKRFWKNNMQYRVPDREHDEIERVFQNRFKKKLSVVGHWHICCRGSVCHVVNTQNVDVVTLCLIESQRNV